MATLLDFLVTDDSRWTLGWDGDSMECSVEVLVDSGCEPALEPKVVVGANNAGGQYAGSFRIEPFTITANLTKSTMCFNNDDPNWLDKAMAAVTERAVGRAMLRHPEVSATGFLFGEGARQVGTTGDAATVALARQTWLDTVLTPENDGLPFLHVGNAALPGLLADRVVKRFGPGSGDLVSAWGDPVVVSTGYGTDLYAAFSGPFAVLVSPVDTVEPAVFRNRDNTVLMTSGRVAGIDLNPCSVVLAGGRDIAAP